MESIYKKFGNIVGLSSTCCFLCLTNVGHPGVGKVKEQIVKKMESRVDKETLKEKFHEGIDSLDQEKAHQVIDQIADYFDKEKIKRTIDEIACYLDKEKMKELIDYAADNFDKEKIKGMIDVIAEALDREKLKTAFDEMVASLDIDKEKIKESFDSSVDKVAESLEQATNYLEDEIRHLGSNREAIDSALQKYNWKKWLKGSASYGPATLKNLRFANSNRPVVVVRAGEKIEGDVECSLDRSQCSSLSLYRVILGIQHRGGQTSIFNHFGIRAGKETDHFTLTAPTQKGIYRVGFRVVEAAREETALKAWDELDKKERSDLPAIGLLIVI